MVAPATTVRRIMRDGAARGADPGRGRSAERFDAFISYSRGDEQVAAALERAMERFATPFYRRRRLSVFRDATSMTVDPDLWEAITHPMDRARFVIVLCSGHAARSKWVNREIAYCIETKGVDHLVPVALEGTWRWDAERGSFAAGDDVGVPPALVGAYDAEPLYSDLRALDRTAGADLRRDRAFSTEVTKLVSRVTGTPVEQLVGEERRVRRRTVRLFAGAFVLVTALAVLAGAMAVRAATQERLAKDRERQAVAERERAEAAEDDAVLARDEAQAAEADAVVARDEAEASEERAKAEARRNLARALAGASGDQLVADRSLGLLLAGAARQLDPGPATQAAVLRAVVAESRATDRFDPWTAAGDGAPELLALSPSGRYAAFARFVNGFEGSQVTFVEIGEEFRILGSVFGGSDPAVAFAREAPRAVVLGGGPFNATRPDRQGRQITGDDLRIVELDRPAAGDGSLPTVQPPPFASHGFARARIAVSADGLTVAIGRRDGSLHVEDVAAGTASERLVGWGLPVTAVAVSDDGTTIAAVAGDTLTVFAADRNEPIAVYPLPRSAAFTVPGAAALAFAGSNDRLAMVLSFGAENPSGSLVVVDTRSGFPITREAGFGDLDPDRVSIVVSDDGALVAAGGSSSVVLDLRTDYGLPARIGGRVLAFDDAGRRVLTDDAAGRVSVRSVADGLAGALPLDPASTEPGAVGQRLVAAVFDRSGDAGGEGVLTAGSTLVSWQPAGGPPASSFVPSTADVAGSLDDGTLIVVGDRLGSRAARLDASTGAASELPVTDVASVAPLLVLEPDVEQTTLAEVDPVTGAVVRRRTVPQTRYDRLTLVAVAPDRSTIVVVAQPIGQVSQGSDLRLRRMAVLDVSGDAPVELPVVSLGTGRDVIASFTADGRVLMVADGAVVRATDIGGDGTWREVLEAPATITGMATTASGVLLVGTTGGDILAVPASDLGPDATAPASSSVLTRLAGVVDIWPSPDRPWIAVRSADGTVRVVDTDRGEVVVELPETTATSSAVWAGDVLALAHGDGIHLWDLSVERAANRVCELAGRGLRPDERARYAIDAEVMTCG